jgi:outer membrane protein OmpA-like peptidoglycan-associated protein/outer membrane murein-binding lipoprotein Lpp
MSRRPIQPLWLLLALTIAGCHLGGCTIGAKLRAKSTEISELTSEIERRGYKCAPKELAVAKAHQEFGTYELSMGHFTRADEHLAKAYEAAQLADINSRAVECKDIVIVNADRDGDGIFDKFDQCPDDPEDFDGYEDVDGCPEDQDTDGDTIPDSRDLCPTEPGLPENQGCPKVVKDKDQDGIADDVDRCPLDPEDIDSFQDQDGCPDLDNDNDGIADVNDQCPNEPEDIDNFQDEDGCPDYDNDNDQILDVNDQCPNEAEDYDGDEDTDGCPDIYKTIIIKEDRIELKDKIYFDTNRTRIKPVSYPILDEITDVLRKGPSMRIAIRGHTDSVGGRNKNQRLSEGRAKSVRAYLIGQGIDPGRLSARGFGEDQPIEDNSTTDGRAVNRRVEFKITAQ